MQPSAFEALRRAADRAGWTDRLIINVAICAFASGLSVCIISMNLTISSATAGVYAPSPAHATVPVAILLIGMMAASLPLSFIFSRFGRRFGFLSCVSFGLLGCLFLGAGMSLEHWGTMLFGYFLIGYGVGASQFYYFAANDGAPSNLSGRISGIVLLGGLIAAMLGPRAAVFASESVLWNLGGTPPVELIGVPYILAGFFLLKGATLLKFRPLAETVHHPGRVLNITGLVRVMSSLRFWAAALVPASAYGAMTLVMNATTPMMILCGFDLSNSSTVISWHLIAMFAPAPFCGWLADRYGPGRCAGTGFVCLGLAGPITMVGVTFSHFAVALIVLGLGWGLANVSGAKLVVALSKEGDKAETEALNTIVVSCFNIFAALFAGIIFVQSGWTSVIGISNLIVGIGLVATLMTVLLPLKKQIKGA